MWFLCSYYFLDNFGTKFKNLGDKVKILGIKKKFNHVANLLISSIFNANVCVFFIHWQKVECIKLQRCLSVCLSVTKPLCLDNWLNKFHEILRGFLLWVIYGVLNLKFSPQNLYFFAMSEQLMCRVRSNFVSSLIF